MQNGHIPKDPAWCSDCVTAKDGKPCAYHRGPDGKPTPYEGIDAYKPSEWVLEVVGGRYRSFGRVYLCFGYDPRNGFWMRTVDSPPEGEPAVREANISEHAIGRTYHRVFMKLGSYWLLDHAIKLGRVPTEEETKAADLRVTYSLAMETLRDLGCIVNGQITDVGRKAVVDHAAEFGCAA